MSSDSSMKRLIVIGTLLLCSLWGSTQQLPHYTQYVLNNYILNPALSGIENYTDIRLSARDQWVGLEGAPQTAYLTIHAPLGKKDYKTTATSFAVPDENPRGQAYWENYTASAPHHGIGLTILNDRTGNFSRFTAAASYAYHLGLNPTTNLSAGFSAGVSTLGRDGSKADFSGTGDPLDPAQAGTAQIYKLHPDLSAGLWLYAADYFIGVSAQQIIPQRLTYLESSASSTGKLVPHFFATAGYRYLLTDDLNLLPSVMVKYVAHTPTSPQFDLNVKMQYRDLLWLGGSYRLKDGYAAMIGLNTGNVFNIGYAYDFTQTRLNTASKGTHELMIGFMIGNRYDDTCPRNVW